MLPSVLKLTTRANKVYITSATVTLKECIRRSRLIPFLNTLVDFLQSQSKSQRIAVVDCICLISDLSSSDEIQSYCDIFELAISTAIIDSCVEVRDFSRKLFEKYQTNSVPNRLSKYLPFNIRFLSSLPDIAKRYLKIDKSKELKPISSSVLTKVPVKLDEKLNYGSHLRVPKKEISIDSVKSAVIIDNFESKTTRLIGRLQKASRVQPEDNTGSKSLLSYGAQRVIKQPTDQLPKPKFAPAQRVVNSSTNEANSVCVENNHLNQLETSIFKTATTSTSSLTESRIPNNSTSIILERRQLSEEVSPKPARRDPEANGNRIPKPTAVKSPIKGQKNSSNIDTDKTPDKGKLVKVKSKTTIPAHQLPFSRQSVSKPFTLSKTASLTNLEIDIKSNDWSKRSAAFETLQIQVKASTDNSDKVIKMILRGLTDGHFKVVQSALDCVLALVNNGSIPMVVIDSILPRIASIAYYPLQKTRPTVIEKCYEAVNAFLDQVSLPIIGQSIVNSLGNPSYTVKHRLGCIGLLKSLSDDQFMEICSKPLSISI